ncbi:MAG: T9SS type A sorting domain-containing protein [Bacteroidia bacterium]
MGADITYECINACTTRVYLKVYRDCTGSNFIGNNLTWTAPGCTPPSAINNWSTQVTTEVSPICPSTPTACNTPGAPINGVQEFAWYRDYNTCSGTPCTYTLEWTDCCRNPIITSLQNAGGQGIAMSSTHLNTALGSCNNSPVFTNIPMFYACNGMDYDFHLGAYDIDGDSLSYSLSSCYSSPGQLVTYNAGFSQTAPLGPTWNVSLDPQTGLLHLTANPGNIQTGVLCITISEFRNGVQIGQLQRDMQVSILACGANARPTVGAPTNLSGATASGYTVTVPVAGTPFCFDLPTSDASPGQTMRLYWTNPGISATFTDYVNLGTVDTVPGTTAVPPTGRFCWTPPVNGTYYVRFRVEDDFCPVEGFEDRVIKIQVGTCGGSTATASLGTCPSVNFSATPCMAGPVTYTWSGAGGLSGTTANLSHTYAGPGSYAWQVIMTNGSQTDTVTGTVNVTTGPSPATLFSGVHFVAPCSGNLYDTLSVGTYPSYQWSTGATTPEIVAFIGGTYSVTVTATNGCSYMDNTQLFWSSPDIYGVVNTSAAAPLQNQKIMLIEHDTLAQALWAVDSTWTDSLGYYFFCNVTDTLVFLKATPSAFDYPNQMPTYADTTLFWNNAITFYPLTQIPFQHNFSTLSGTNPGGPGFIGGLISQGANKTGAIGDPMPGVRVFLRDRNTGNILGNRISDTNGYFSFAGIPLGDYEIVPDRPLVSTTNVPQLSLTSMQPVMDSLDFQMHRYWLELVLHPTAVDPVIQGINISANPNPFRGSTQISLELPSDTEVAWEAFDIRGQRVGASGNQVLREGVHRYSVGEELKPGIYMVRIHAGAFEKVLKVVKVAE